MFTQFTSFYTSLITCDNGYLLNGTNTSSVTVTCEKLQRPTRYLWQGDLNYQCKCKWVLTLNYMHLAMSLGSINFPFIEVQWWAFVPHVRLGQSKPHGLRGLFCTLRLKNKNKTLNIVHILAIKHHSMPLFCYLAGLFYLRKFTIN